MAWHSGWADLESNITGFTVAFGTAPGGATDVMDWTPVGLNDTFTLWGLELQTNTTYYSCVAAVNGAGLWSEPACSDGVIYDDTPPVMLRVFDGWDANTDIDAQGFLNLAFATYEGVDPESGVVDYVFALGRTPGGVDLLAPESGGNATFNGVVGRPFDTELLDGDTVYATVWAVNMVGLWSEPLSSDGVRVGDTVQVPLKPGAGETSVALGTQHAAPDDEDDAEASKVKEVEEEPPETVAGVTFPAGAVGSSASFTGGPVSAEDIASGKAVNASAVPPPANNFKFGDYSYVVLVLWCANVCGLFQAADSTRVMHTLCLQVLAVGYRP